MNNTNKILAAFTLGAVASAANAGVVSVSQSVSLGQLLNGSSTGVAFDLNAALAAQGVNSANVVSGNLVVYGLSQADYDTSVQPYSGYFQTSSNQRTVQYTYTYYVSCGFWGSSSCARTGYSYYSVSDRDYLHERNITHIDQVADQMTVTAGATSASDTASDHASGGSASGSYYEGSSGSYYNGYNNYYGRDFHIYNSISGALEVNLGLDIAALFDVRDDGLFSFDIAAPDQSQFLLQYAQLDLLAFLPDAVADGLPDGAVPEPGTIGLFAGALGLMAMARRRRYPQK